MFEFKKKDINKKRIFSYFNIGTIMFLVIGGYLASNVIYYLNRSPHAVYEVNQSEISDTVKGTGVIIRKEEVVQTKEEGYINATLSDGDRVQRNGTVYTIDSSGKIQEEIDKFLEKNDMDMDEEREKIFDDLCTFTDGYDAMDFYEVSETENRIEHDLLSYTGQLISANKKELKGKYDFKEVKSEKVGLISYSSDGLESLTSDDITKNTFLKKVHMTDLHTNKKVAAGTDVYRITTSQKWKIVVNVNKAQFEYLSNLERRLKDEKQSVVIPITILNDDFSLTVPFSCFQKGSSYYIQLSFSNYVQRYLDMRYLSVELMMNQESGLKIPVSSLVEKEAYRIPKKYLSKGSDTATQDKVNLVYLDKDGKKKDCQVTVNILGESGDYVHIYSSEIKVGDQIQSHDEEGNTSTFMIAQKTTIYGVYSINSGFALFRYVSITDRNEDYCIIDSENSKVKLYDRIILNSDSIRENDIIY